MSVRLMMWTTILFLFTACATVDDVDPPTINLVDLSIGKPGFLNQELLLSVRIGNPNDFAIPLEGLTLTVEINGRKIADGLSDETVTLPRLGFATISVSATASTLGLLRELIAFDAADSLHYRISGKAFIGHPLDRKAVPYDRTGELSIFPDRSQRNPRKPARPPGNDGWRTFRSI